LFSTAKLKTKIHFSPLSPTLWKKCGFYALFMMVNKWLKRFTNKDFEGSVWKKRQVALVCISKANPKHQKHSHAPNSAQSKSPEIGSQQTHKI
jgi:hypothetical protein